MIKPETLWHLFRDCKDSKYIGDICRALGEQDIELDYGQKQIVSIVLADSEAMDKSMEKKRKNWRNKKRTQRKTQESSITEGDTESAKSVKSEGEKPCPPMSPSSLSLSLSPSLPPSHSSSDTNVSSEEENAATQLIARARDVAADAACSREVKAQLPCRSDMELYAKEQGIPIDYLDKFLEDIKTTGYTFMRHDGIVVPVRLNNFRNLLGRYWSHTKRQEARDAAREAQREADEEKRALSQIKHADNWLGSTPEELANEPI